MPDRAHVDEHVLAALIGLDKAVALGLVKPFHRSGRHYDLLRIESAIVSPGGEPMAGQHGSQEATTGKLSERGPPSVARALSQAADTSVDSNLGRPTKDGHGSGLNLAASPWPCWHGARRSEPRRRHTHATSATPAVQRRKPF